MQVDTIKVFTRDSVSLDTDRAGRPITNLPFMVDVNNQTIKANPGGSVDLDSVIQYLNSRYDSVKLEKVRQSHDTLYTVIRNSNYLGEQMGSTGSSEYLANAIINLTSVPGIRYINLDMEMHSHASPGVFSRKDYARFKILK